MLKRYFTTGIAVVIAGTFAAAQAPQTPAPGAQPPADQRPTTQAPPAGQQPATAAAPATITLTGCLVREQDVPGRKPNVAERAGVLEDYILTSATAASPAGPTGTAGSTASRNISAMYKVEGIPDEKLKSMLGKRVEVTGRVDADDAREVGTTGAASATPRTASADMPEFEATAIREVEGTCSPAQPRQ